MFKIVERSAHDQKLRFILSKTTLSIANGLRRVMLSEIDTPAIDITTISFSEDLNFSNTSSLHDEFLSHRIGYAVLDVSVDRISNLKFFICDPSDTDKAFINTSDDIMNFTTNHFTIIDASTGQRVEPESVFLAENLVNRLKPRQQIKTAFTASVRKVREADKESAYNHQPGRVKFNYIGDGIPSSFEMEFCTWGQQNLTAIHVVKQALLVLEGKINKVIGDLESGLQLHKDNVWDYCYSIKIKDEDHTLGNMLAEAIMQTQQSYENAQDCYVAYQKKHPLERELELRIKTGNHEQNAYDCLSDSCLALHKMLQGMSKSFEQAVSSRL